MELEREDSCGERVWLTLESSWSIMMRLGAGILSV